jgi:GT2 family glycosyltransferase
MPSWPDVTIMVITYNRRDVLHGTLTRLYEHLAYSGKLHYIVADDGSNDGTQQMLASDHPDVHLVQSLRLGLGGNTNAGLRAAFELSDLVGSLQDDMHLLCTLDLDKHVQKLQEDPSAGFIRLWGVAGHQYIARLDQQHWRIAWDSPELYIPSDRPHLKHRRFHLAYGFYPEGRSTGDTEEAWSHQCRAIALSQGGPDVLVPHALDIESNFFHAGEGIRWRDQGL